MLEKNKMLKKLTIYELKKTWKKYALMCGIILAAGLFMGVFQIYKNTEIHSTMRDIANNIVVLYMMGIPSILVLITTSLSKRYYKSLYMSEGYFSFTLPASIKEVVSSKHLAGIVLMMAGMVATYISLFFAVIVGGGQVKDITANDVGNGFVASVLFTVLAIVNLMVCNLSVTVGRLWTKHKLLGNVLCFGCLWAAIGIVASIANYIMIEIACLVTPGPSYVWPEEAAYVIFAVDFICAGVLCYILDRVSIAITERTLNLD
ncbi:MAG: hypothetical protein J5802_05405 [Butyrivibrio sp.]|nr:hypothetical protein [Butyrivibrio sp.]